MKTLVVDEKGQLSVKEIPAPEFGPCQALVKTLSCGVCNGTDTKLIHGTFKNFSSYPAILGHEGVGQVIEVGEKVTSFKKGDIVLLPFLEQPVDGMTPGWGAYSEYAVIGDAAACAVNGMGAGTPDFNEGYLAQTVIRPTDQVNPVEASMIITFREVLSAIRCFGWKPNENVLIYGAGPVGLCFTRFARLLGMGTIITTDITDEKVAGAVAAGADYGVNTAREDVVSLVKTLFPEGIDYVVDAVGINSLINEALSLIKYNGKVCCYGISPKLGMDIDWSKAPYNWSLQFVQWPSKREEGEAHQQIMAWINSGVLKPMDFISHVFPFEKILDAFELLADRSVEKKKIVIKYD